MKVKIDEGFSLTVTYSNFWSTDSAVVSVSDNEGDSLYLTVSFSGDSTNSSLIVLDNQDWDFDLFVNMSSFEFGNYTVSLSLWDIFHDVNVTQAYINLEMKHFDPPHFASELPTSIDVQRWIITTYNLPQIIDKDGDYSGLNVNSNM